MKSARSVSKESGAGKDVLRRRIADAPTASGVYRWLDAEGNILYVGKAKNLRDRLRSYLQGPFPANPWKQAMLAKIHDFDVTVTGNELEALLLETNLIKELRPKFNVLMKDDKNYVYVRVTMQERYPCVESTRRLQDDGAKYFGPFTSRYETRDTLDMLHRIFPYKACRRSLDALNKGLGASLASDKSPGTSLASDVPCLEYQIGECCGLCVGVLSCEEYRRNIEQLITFYRGNHRPVIERISELMRKAVLEKKFERAAQLRDYLRTIEKLNQRQIVSEPLGEDSDIVGVAVLSGRAHVVLLKQRSGKIIAELHFPLMGQSESAADVLEQFLPQYYTATADLPAQLLVAEDFVGREALEAFLSERAERCVRVLIPERGRKHHLLSLAEENAHEKAKQAEAKWEAEARNIRDALSELQQLLGIPGGKECPALSRIEGSALSRIEGYDISHLGGTETVGSMVVALKGKPTPQHYRSFALYSLRAGQIDDYAALREVLRRRCRHLTSGQEVKQWMGEGVTFRKARKADADVILQIIKEHPHELTSHDVRYQDFMVAVKEKTLIAFARLYGQGGRLLEFKSLWVDPRYRGQRLGQFLARKLLRSVKRGRVYVTIDPTLEEYYAELGFRHVLKPPRLLEEKLARERMENPQCPCGLIMVYDAGQGKPDPSLEICPDLIVIDGGKGQLSAALEALREASLNIPVVALAKREEEVFVPGREASVTFSPNSPAKFLLMRLRDEAHRFANKLREKRLEKHAVLSSLDAIPGIGGVTKQELLQKFRSLEGIRNASDEELRTVLSAEQLGQLRRKLSSLRAGG